MKSEVWSRTNIMAYQPQNGGHQALAGTVDGIREPMSDFAHTLAVVFQSLCRALVLERLGVVDLIQKHGCIGHTQFESAPIMQGHGKPD